MKCFAPVAFLVVLALAAPATAITTVYSNDFDNPAVVLGGVGATLTGGVDVPTINAYNAIYGNIRRNETVNPSVATELTLSNLPAHASVDIDFLLAFLDSWDSYDGCCGVAPDNYEFYVDGNLIATYTYNNALGTVKDIDAGTLLAEYTQFDNNGFYNDTVVDMSGDPGLTIPHSASTLTIEWLGAGPGWQGGGDEAIGLDNVRITLDGVPEPTTWGLAIVATLGGLARRRLFS